MSNNNTTYKDSPLGKIPIDWEVRIMGEVATFINGKAYKQEELLSEGKYRVLRVGNFFTKGDWYYSDIEMEDDKYVFNGDLMYAWSASFGPKYWNDEKTVYHYHIWKVIPSDLITKQYLYSLLLFDTEKIFSSKQGGTMFHITKGDMEKRKLSLPPLPEQTRIAEVLSAWDKAIINVQATIEQVEQRNKWLMQELLTGKRRLKGFSGEWKSYSYEKLLKVVKRNFTWDENELYKLISVRRRSGGIFYREALYGHQILVKNLRTAKEGDFLFSKMQILHGASALVTKEFDGAKISGSYIAVVAKDVKTLDMKYFEWYSKMPYFYHQTFISSYGVHIEKMTFDFDTFLQLDISLPSLEEQTAIAQVLQAAANEVQVLRSKLDKLKEQKKGLMQVLLTGKKRLKIV